MKTPVITFIKTLGITAAAFFLTITTTCADNTSYSKCYQTLEKYNMVGIGGNIKAAKEDMKDIRIEVYVNGVWAETKYPDANGKFCVKMNLNEVYEIRILHPDYVEETIVADTHISFLELQQIQTRAFFYTVELISVKELLSLGLTSVTKEIPFVQYNSDKKCLSYHPELSQQKEIHINPFNAKK
ncbi:MAG: hypothetical protein D6707_10000 [Bacteroidetes bacterium]|nr:MAG: hypothetical protein D6707_10000 [Bacteroidota bacterium]